MSARGSWYEIVVRESSLTGDTSSGDGHNGREVLERHLCDYGSWITGWTVSFDPAGKLRSCVVCDRGWLVRRLACAGGRSCLGKCHRAGDDSGGVEGRVEVVECCVPDGLIHVRTDLGIIKAAGTGGSRVIANGYGIGGWMGYEELDAQRV